MSGLDKELVAIIQPFLELTAALAKQFRVSNAEDYLMTHTSKDDLDASIRDGWDKVAPIWPSIESRDNYFITMYTLLQQLAVPEENERWLSLGSGPGIYEIWFNRFFNVEITVTDLSPEMVRMAKMINDSIRVVRKKGAGHRKNSLEFSAMSMANITFPENIFDAVLSINALQWVPQWRKAISEISRVMKEGGHLYLICNIDQMSGVSKDGDNHVIADITIDALMDEMETNKLDLLFTRIMLVKEGQLGCAAKRIFIHAEKSSTSFKSWRSKGPKGKLTLLNSSK